MAYACKTSSARSIVGVIPYLPYSKQCKMRKRGCIVTKLLAKMMCKSGLTHIITMDLHQKEIQGFYDCPVDNLRASPFLLQYIQESVSAKCSLFLCILRINLTKYLVWILLALCSNTNKSSIQSKVSTELIINWLTLNPMVLHSKCLFILLLNKNVNLPNKYKL